MKITIIFSVFVMLVMGSAVTALVDAKLYKTYKGVYLTEQAYESIVLECNGFQQEGYIDESIDCAEWILTEEGIEGLANAINQRSDDIIENFKKEQANKTPAENEVLNKFNDRLN